MSLKPVPMQPAATTDEAQATGGSGFHLNKSVEKNSIAITALTISERNQADRLAAGRGEANESSPDAAPSSTKIRGMPGTEPPASQSPTMRRDWDCFRGFGQRLSGTWSSDTACLIFSSTHAKDR